MRDPCYRQIQRARALCYSLFFRTDCRTETVPTNFQAINVPTQNHNKPQPNPLKQTECQSGSIPISWRFRRMPRNQASQPCGFFIIAAKLKPPLARRCSTIKNAVNATGWSETTLHCGKMPCKAALISPRIIYHRPRSGEHRMAPAELDNEPDPHPQNQRRSAGPSLARHHTPAGNHLKSLHLRLDVELASAAFVKQSAGLPGKHP